MNMETNQGAGSGNTAATAGDRPLDQIKNTAGQAKQSITQKSSEAATTIKEGARDTAQKLKQKGAETVARVQDQGKQLVQESKSEVGERISGLGAAVRRVADQLREENDPRIASYADMVAERVERAGDYVRARDFGEIARDAGQFARQRPELVIGGMFIAGLAISRFLKASNSRRDNSLNDPTEWDSGAYDSQYGDSSLEVLAAKQSTGGNVSGGSTQTQPWGQDPQART